ncbi:MAG: conjugal transfer protein TraD [Alphaproteobacteria bacterium]|nr:conjugal transfer protein TraD [Alphaproteobacteria bacterium]
MTKKKISFYTSKNLSVSTSRRKAETRTKIQLGGLVIKSGLTNVFSIAAGADLQLDSEAREKATLLLGALIETSQNLTLNPTQKEGLAALGHAAFAEHFLTSKEKVVR